MKNYDRFKAKGFFFSVMALFSTLNIVGDLFFYRERSEENEMSRWVADAYAVMDATDALNEEMVGSAITWSM